MDTHLHWVWNGDQRRSFFLFQTNVGSSSPVLCPPMTNRAYSLLPSTSSTACSSLPTGYDTQYVVMCSVQCAMCISARHDGRDWPLCHPLRCQDSCISRSVPTVDLGLHCEWEGGAERGTLILRDEYGSKLYKLLLKMTTGYLQVWYCPGSPLVRLYLSSRFMFCSRH